jgi:hypothetical protein
MAVISGARRAARARVGRLDVLGSLVLFVLSVVAASVVPHEHRFEVRWPAVLLAGIGCAALLWRRQHPCPVLLIAVGCGVMFQALGVRESPLVTSPVVVSIYSVAAGTDRRTAWTMATASAAVLVGAAVVSDPASWLSPDNAAMLAWTALPWATGCAPAGPTWPPSRNGRSTPNAPARRRRGSGWRPNGCASPANCTTSSPTTSP